ncbi:MAG: flagellar hook-basal body complex protein [Pseudomonadota bacterium]
MGIFGALTTAVTGMRAQSYALENISGNIANSQTTAYKRIDSTFVDLIPDNNPNKQLAGNVSAFSRSTNNVQGDVQNASIGTFMAVNGQGFFVVQKPDSFTDGRPVFGGVDMYTRRGDFQTDKNGYLVNGAGYYLMGIPIDATTGNLVGSVPQLLQFANDFLPAQATTSIQYRANLASYPLTAGHDTSIPKSELLNPSNYSAIPTAGAPTAARLVGSGASILADKEAQKVGTVDITSLSSAGGNLRINGVDIAIPGPVPGPAATATDVINLINGAGVGVTASQDSSGRLKLDTPPGDFTNSINIDGTNSTGTLLTELGLTAGASAPTNLMTQGKVSQGQTLTIQVQGSAMTTITFGTGPGQVSTLAQLNTQLAALAGGTATLDSSGNLQITTPNPPAGNDIVIGGDITMTNFGIRTLRAVDSDGTVRGNDVATFIRESVGGGAITAYDISGSPVNIQLRWAKTDSKSYGGTDTWNLFYQVSSTATGNQVAWKNAGVNYTFSANGQMTPVVSSTTLSGVTVDGVSLGDINVNFGSGGVTQFADPNGNVQVNLLQQNGFAAGTLQTVAVNDKGRVVGTYSNGRSLDLAEITLANFSGTNGLKRMDGGAFSATDESGPPTYNASGKILGSSLEGSNTDIADEFTKLIVTQQAYSANTRVITTSNTMMQDMLNMLR